MGQGYSLSFQKHQKFQRLCRLSTVPTSGVVRRPSIRPSLTFHIFDFSSETTERNSTKLDRKQDGRGR